MNFEACCAKLELSEEILSFHPRCVSQCSIEQLEKDVKWYIGHYFRKSAQKAHPDKGGNEAEFKDLLNAYNKAIAIIDELIATKKQTEDPEAAESKKVPLSVVTHNKSINELTNEIDPIWLMDFWRKTQSEVEQFAEEVGVINDRMAREFKDYENEMYKGAFAIYQSNVDFEYRKFRKNEFAQFSISQNNDLEKRKKDVIDKYKKPIMFINIKIGLCILFSFLIIPILIGFNLRNHREYLKEQRQFEISDIESERVSSINFFKGTSRQDWLKTRFQSVNEFRAHANETEEGKFCEKQCGEEYLSYYSKMSGNNRWVDSVKGLYVSIKDAGEHLCRSLNKPHAISPLTSHANSLWSASSSSSSSSSSHSEEKNNAMDTNHTHTMGLR